MRSLLAVVCGSLAALALTSCGSSGEPVAALPPGNFAAAAGTLSPPIHLFGDTVTAEATVVVDRNRLDPDGLSFKATFDPYEQVGDTEVVRRDAGDISEITYRMRLRCLAFECLQKELNTLEDPSGSGGPPPAGAPRIFRFEPGRVLYADPAQKKPRLLRSIRWGLLESASRINAQDPTQVFGFPFRSTLVPLPTLTYRISPTALALTLLVLAGLLLVLPVTLVARRLRRRRPPPLEEPEPELTPLERALQLVEWSLERPDPADRRAALDALATELDVVGDPTLAIEARAAGWSRPTPQPDDARRMVAAVKEAHGPAS